MSELYELLTFEAFGQRYPELTSRHQILPGRGVFCKAERLQSGVIGTYAMPQRMAPTGEKHFFGYYLTEKKLLLVEKGGFLQGLLPGLPGETPAQLLSELLARLTAEDMESLQHYEERLTALEEVLLAQQAEDFDKKIFRIRRELSVLAGYYAQLDDLYAVLADAIPDAEEHVQRLLEHLSGKAQRLLTMTEQEKEYSLQLREMHQTQVDMRQNQIMKILTIVTTVPHCRMVRHELPKYAGVDGGARLSGDLYRQRGMRAGGAVDLQTEKMVLRRRPYGGAIHQRAIYQRYRRDTGQGSGEAGHHHPA